MYKKLITDAVKEAVESLGFDAADINLDKPVVEAHGDYSTNVALKLFKTSGLPSSKSLEAPIDIGAARISAVVKPENIGYVQSPKELAEIICQTIKKSEKLQNIVSEIAVADPGFINFTLSAEALLETIRQILDQKEDFGKSKLGLGKTMVIDYSAPNIAKRFSVGHLRSTIIGQALYNLYVFLGYNAVGDNHLGDWGTQFGMILAAVEKNNLDINNLTVDDLEKLYVDYTAAAKEDPSLRDKAKVWFKKLEDGDEVARKMWQSAVNISMAEFNRIYEILDIRIDQTFGESFYEDKMDSVIKEAKEKGLSRESEGAQVMDLGENMPPGMLLKSDGTTTYFIRDLATIKYRLETWGPSLIIYEVGAEQTLHFKQVFAAAERFGWTEGLDLVHVAHGLFLFEGKKMSTRGGTTVKLEELLQKACQKARSVMDEAQIAKEIDNDEKESISSQVGIGAIKYFDLKHAPTSNINFVWDQALSMDGNSGPYLQYTYARTQSVLSKSEKSPATNYQLHTTTAEEASLLRSLVHFPDVVENAALTFSPNLLANYLYALAQDFNAFYAACRIADDETRLSLTDATGQVLKNGLHILGIKTPQKM